MPKPAKFTAKVKGAFVRLTGKNYDMEFELRELDGWIKFYQGMAEKYRSKTPSYDQIVEALKPLANRE
jgi:hypothetical protein